MEWCMKWGHANLKKLSTRVIQVFSLHHHRWRVSLVHQDSPRSHGHEEFVVWRMVVCRCVTAVTD